jgi:hypothetical protein
MDVCNPSYLAGWLWKIVSSKPVWATLVRLYLKHKSSQPMVQVADHLPGMPLPCVQFSVTQHTHTHTHWINFTLLHFAYLWSWHRRKKIVGTKLNDKISYLCLHSLFRVLKNEHIWGGQGSCLVHHEISVSDNYAFCRKEPKNERTRVKSWKMKIPCCMRRWNIRLVFSSYRWSRKEFVGSKNIGRYFFANWLIEHLTACFHVQFTQFI